MPKRVAVVELTMGDGKVLSERVETVRGTAGNPMTREEMIAKARDLIVPVLGADKFQKLSTRSSPGKREKRRRAQASAANGVMAAFDGPMASFSGENTSSRQRL